MLHQTTEVKLTNKCFLFQVKLIWHPWIYFTKDTQTLLIKSYFSSMPFSQVSNTRVSQLCKFYLGKLEHRKDPFTHPLHVIKITFGIRCMPASAVSITCHQTDNHFRFRGLGVFSATGKHIPNLKHPEVFYLLCIITLHGFKHTGNQGRP